MCHDEPHNNSHDPRESQNYGQRGDCRSDRVSAVLRQRQILLIIVIVAIVLLQTKEALGSIPLIS